MAWNVHRAVQVPAELIEAKWRRMVSDRRLVRLVASPCICVKERVAQVFVYRTVEKIRPTLGHQLNKAARGLAVLRWIAGGENLFLRNCVNIGNADLCSVATGTDHRCAIKRDQGFSGTRSIYYRPAEVRRKVE